MNGVNSLKYKNLSLTTKKFYGVTFKPGETKEVPGYINDPKFVRIKDELKTTPVASRPVSTSTNKTPVKEETKAEVTK